MMLPTAAYSAEIPTSATKTGSCRAFREILQPVGQSFWAACQSPLLRPISAKASVDGRSQREGDEGTEGSPRICLEAKEECRTGKGVVA